MRKFFQIVLLIAISVMIYAIAPLLVVSNNKAFLRPSSTVSSLQDTVGDFADEALQKASDTLHITTRCKAPLHYTLGDIDPRFDVSRDDVKADVLKAESIWEMAVQEDILQYDENAGFKINFVFDDRQQQTLELKKLEQQFDTVQGLQEGISKSYDTLLIQYTKKKTQYENALDDYTEQSDAYEKQVSYWNSHGGAPEKEYKQLQQQKQDALSKASDLEKQRRALNTLVSQLNDLVKKEKKVVNGYNQDVNQFESTTSVAKEFDQGVYTGKEINIYQFNETSDLVLVLAHEMGHALRMDHVENPQSIMYYLMDKQDLKHPSPSAEDMQAFSSRCQ